MTSITSLRRRFGRPVCSSQQGKRPAGGSVDVSRAEHSWLRARRACVRSASVQVPDRGYAIKFLGLATAPRPAPSAELSVPHIKIWQMSIKASRMMAKIVVCCLTTRPKRVRRRFPFTEHQPARCRGNKRLIERSFSHVAAWLPIGSTADVNHVFLKPRIAQTAAKAATTNGRALQRAPGCSRASHTNERSEKWGQ